jgi:hypothetical protein
MYLKLSVMQFVQTYIIILKIVQIFETLIIYYVRPQNISMFVFLIKYF